MKRWSRAALAALLLFCAGCGEGAKLVQADEQGGVATYPYREQVGHMATRFRGEAIQLIEEHCPGGYAIIKEGEVQGRNRITSTLTGGEVVTEHRWGIRFRCK